MIQKWIPWLKVSRRCRNSSGYTNLWPLLKPIEGRKILCKAHSHAFGREEEGTVLGDIEASLTRTLCECILYFYGEIWGILENVPRFLKHAFHIPEERHLGMASLGL